MSKDEARGWGFGIAFGLLLSVIFCWSWPTPLDEPYQETTGSSPYGHSSYHEIPKSWDQWWADVGEKTWSDPIALYTLVLTVFTGFVGAATIALWSATRAVEVSKRSIIRGAGTIHVGATARAFALEASNAGNGPAEIRSVEWGFATVGQFGAVANYVESHPSGEMIFPGTRGQIVKIIPLPYTSTIDVMIFFRFEYFDVNRKRLHKFGQVMQLGTPALANVPIFIEAPDAYRIDTFPVN